MRVKEIISLLIEIRDSLKEKNILNKEFLTIEEASAFLGVSTSCIYKITSQKKVTYYKPSGKLIYFKRDDIEQFVLSNPIYSKDVMNEMSADYLLKKLK